MKAETLKCQKAENEAVQDDNEALKKNMGSPDSMLKDMLEKVAEAEGEVIQFWEKVEALQSERKGIVAARNIVNVEAKEANEVLE